ncbi:MAG: hypothetical protein SGI71_13160 [Verrucomicrobiota bacterium]|nr:hypothetical protein [Verrucomicrobiota bacterium]
MMKPSSFSLIVAAAAALVLPPFLLIPMVYHLPKAQLFKDFYEACLWISPAIGLGVFIIIFRLRWTGVVSLRQPAVIIAVLLAFLDLVSPVFFYLFLAVIAGH